MPRLTGRKGQECAEHGDLCKRGGASAFTSERCRPPALDRYGVRIEPVPTEETAFGMVELLHAASGTPVTRSWWDRLSPARKAAELDGADHRLAAVLGEAQERHEALHPPRPAYAAYEPAVSVATPSLSAQRPQEPTGVGVETTPPAPVVELATARRRRRRRPMVRSVNPYGYDDAVHPFYDHDED